MGPHFFSQVCLAGSRSKYVPYSGQLRDFVRQQAHHCRLCFVGPTVWLSLALMRNGWQVRCCYGSFIPPRMGQTLWRHGSLCHCLLVSGITGILCVKASHFRWWKELWVLTWVFFFFVFLLPSPPFSGDVVSCFSSPGFKMPWNPAIIVCRNHCNYAETVNILHIFFKAFFVPIYI